MDIDLLKESIEQKREILYSFGNLYGLSSPFVVQLSQELDELLVLFNKLNKEV